MAPEEVVHSRCCAADCTPSLSVEGVQAIRDKWFGLVLAERFHYLVELVWDDVLGQPRPACDARLHQILGVGKLAPGRLLAQARADCKPLGAFTGSVKLPCSLVPGPGRTFASAIERFNAAPRHPSECVYIWKLLEVVCEQTGAPLSQPVLAERADAKASFEAFQESLKARRGAAKARGGPALEALLAEDEASCERLLHELQPK